MSGGAASSVATRQHLHSITLTSKSSFSLPSLVSSYGAIHSPLNPFQSSPCAVPSQGNILNSFNSTKRVPTFEFTDTYNENDINLDDYNNDTNGG